MGLAEVNYDRAGNITDGGLEGLLTVTAAKANLEGGSRVINPECLYVERGRSVRLAAIASRGSHGALYKALYKGIAT